METVGWVVMSLIGLVAVIAGARMDAKIVAIRRWPKAGARVIGRDVVPQTAAVPSERGFRWNVAVKYRYQADGREYESDRFAPYVTGRSRADAEKVLARIPDEPTIHYDPKDPSSSYLDTGSRAYAWVAIMTGLVFFPIGLLMLISRL